MGSGMPIKGCYSGISRRPLRSLAASAGETMKRLFCVMGTQHIDRASLCLSHFQGQNEEQGPREGLMPGGEGVKQEDVDRALQVFGLRPPLTRNLLEQKHRELLLTWHPHRYANLTNNPRKYMQMYKKGEAMTKKVNAAYELLIAWLDAERPDKS